MIAEADAARQASVAASTGQAQRFLSVLQAYNAAKDVTMQRLYLETMQEILTKTPAVILDDRLQGVLPLLPLGTPRRRRTPPLAAGAGTPPSPSAGAARGGRRDEPPDRRRRRAGSRCWRCSPARRCSSSSRPSRC